MYIKINELHIIHENCEYFYQNENYNKTLVIEIAYSTTKKRRINDILEYNYSRELFIENLKKIRKKIKKKLN